MKNQLKITGAVAAMAALLLITACTDAVATPTAAPFTPHPSITPSPTATIQPEPIQAAVNQQFKLKPGQYVEIAGASVMLTFVRVSNDSRCPIDVVCVRAGDATIELTATVSGGQTQAVKLIIGGETSAATARVGSYTVTALTLLPAPRAAQPTAPGNYEVTLIVRAA